MKKIEFFKIEGDRINRIRRHCPKCGPGVFLAEHKSRFACGKCGYTEFKGGGIKQPQPQKIDKAPVEQQEQEKTEVLPETSIDETKEEVQQPSNEEKSEEPINIEETPTDMPEKSVEEAGSEEKIDKTEEKEEKQSKEAQETETKETN